MTHVRRIVNVKLTRNACAISTSNVTHLNVERKKHTPIEKITCFFFWFSVSLSRV